jgi:hypothetical protein
MPLCVYLAMTSTQSPGEVPRQPLRFDLHVDEWAAGQ